MINNSQCYKPSTPRQTKTSSPLEKRHGKNCCPSTCTHIKKKISAHTSSPIRHVRKKRHLHKNPYMHTGDIVCAPRGKPSVGLRCIKCIQRVEEIERQRGEKKPRRKRQQPHRPDELAGDGADFVAQSGGPPGRMGTKIKRRGKKKTRGL